MASPSELVGATVSHYRVLRKLGAGGMGVVYEAEDIRLGRRVALKVLPESLGHDHRALQRFAREARAASTLNHPGICTIHEVEEHNGKPVIVMELLSGESLHDRVRKGPLPSDEILNLAIQVADALEAAHMKGIVHRDIKPANLFIVGAGRTKILDFGLARAISPAAAESEADEGSLTAEGVIAGTSSYMSPEQVRGEELDGRSDLFSLGVTLYELATRQRPFQQKNRVLILDAILHAHPAPPRSLNPALPTQLEQIINRCLEKDRDLRYQHASDLRNDLQWLKRDLESESQRPHLADLPVAPSRPRSAGAVPASSSMRHVRFWKWEFIVSAAILAAVVVTAITLLRPYHATALSEKDTLVLADFDNKTGDTVFDDTLKQALAVDLGQSPFLNILSDRKMTATLRLMGRSPDQPVMGEVARELCQRVGSKVMLTGSISALGNNYVVALNAMNCSTGETLIRQQVEARGKEDVLKMLGNSASVVRRRLGESLSSIQKFAAPIEEATTSSLEALKAYSMGRRAGYAKGDVAAIPYYERALELDPNFALAYRALAVSYVNLGQRTRALEKLKKAFDLRERVSEREKYSIAARYYSDFTGELEKANQVYDLYAQSYPRDFIPSLNLGDNYMRMGQWQKALQSTQETLRLEPNSTNSNSNLAFVQLALNRPQDAQATVEQALARNLDALFLRLAFYQTAFVRGDERTMQQQVAWATGRPGEEDWLLSAQSDTEAYFGHLRKAGELSREAVESARHADAPETAALWQVNAALREAEFGNARSAQQSAEASLSFREGTVVPRVAALALARAGSIAQAQKIAEKLVKDFPQDTILQGYWLPSIQAAIEVHANHPARALQILQATVPYELCQSQPFQLGLLYPVYLRGEAYLLARQGNDAANEFQKIIDERGIVLNSSLGALARVGLARAYALQRNVTAARAAYQDFFTRWQDADADIPILQQAKTEYAKLE